MVLNWLLDRHEQCVGLQLVCVPGVAMHSQACLTATHAYSTVLMEFSTFGLRPHHLPIFGHGSFEQQQQRCQLSCSNNRSAKPSEYKTVQGVKDAASVLRSSAGASLTKTRKCTRLKPKATAKPMGASKVLELHQRCSHYTPDTCKALLTQSGCCRVPREGWQGVLGKGHHTAQLCGHLRV